jgi:predicted metalloprotease
MRWGDFRRSSNVEDRRGFGGGSFGPVRMGRRAGGLGIGGIVVLLLVGWALGIDPIALLGQMEGTTGGGYYRSPGSAEGPGQGETGVPDDATGQFVAAVLGETEDRWKEIFAAAGETYQAPKLVMFSGVTRSACGTAQSAMGPFYCPIDQRVYLDTSFFREIETRFGGCDVGSKACQFSQAYVIAHEVGHHVQNLIGVLPRARELQSGLSQAEANEVQVRVELQADCFAGLWANRAQQRWDFLEPGDVDAALQTASAIGDDTLQKRTQGHVVPDSFTHGSAEQRRRWFSTGLEGGTVQSCDTFSAARP